MADQSGNNAEQDLSNNENNNETNEGNSGKILGSNILKLI